MNPVFRKRCVRIDAAGEVHFLTFSCFQRLAFFSKPRTCDWMLDAFELGRQLRLYDLWAFVIMPEHIHAIVYPHKEVRVQQILKTLKQSVAIRARNWLAENAPQYLQTLSRQDPTGHNRFHFWQRGGGYDRNLRSASDVHQKIAYIHHNPVRRGLVAKPSDWKWSSSLAWETGEDTPLMIDRHSVPRLHVS